jgi:hypothetical protein
VALLVLLAAAAETDIVSPQLRCFASERLLQLVMVAMIIMVMVMIAVGTMHMLVFLFLPVHKRSLAEIF